MIAPRHCTLVAVGVALLLAGSAAPTFAQTPPPSTGEQPQTDRVSVAKDRKPLPYDVWRGAMLFRMIVADQPVLAILDTGASASLLDIKFARALGLALEPEQAALRTAGGGDLPLWRTRDLPITLPGQFSINASLFRVADLSAISGNLARDVQFLLGQDILRSSVLMVDPEKRTFEFAPSGAIRRPPEADEINLQTGAPLATVTAGDRDFTVTLDTGQSSDLCVSPAVWADLSPQISAITRVSKADVLGVANETREGRLAELKLGNTRLHNVGICERALTGLPVDGLLGYSILSRFQFAMDLRQGKLWLMPMPRRQR